MFLFVCVVFWYIYETKPAPEECRSLGDPGSWLAWLESRNLYVELLLVYTSIITDQPIRQLVPSHPSHLGPALRCADFNR